MPMQQNLFSRTQNENGTYNTRCLYCFMTVASCVETEALMERAEARHLCPERVLAELQKKMMGEPDGHTAHA